MEDWAPATEGDVLRRPVGWGGGGGGGGGSVGSVEPPARPS